VHLHAANRFAEDPGFPLRAVGAEAAVEVSLR
jgi:hypothetical protein